MKKLLVHVLVILFVLTGCAQEPSMPPESPDVSDIPDSQPSSHITQALSAHAVSASESLNLAIDSLTFDLGGESLPGSTRDVQYRLRGTIAAPKDEEKHPVVLILHGSHENVEDDKRFDTGFAYLCEALAQNGYIAVAPDISPAFLWKYGENDLEKTVAITNRHIALLQEANHGDDAEYGISLSGRIDFDNLFLLGLSRGGGAAFEVAAEQILLGQDVRGILSVAPATVSDRTSFPNVPTNILVPEYDGDVTDWQGYHLYYLIRNSNLPSPVTLTLLEGANHNYFNANLTKNDAEFLHFPADNQLTREEQEQFLIDYTLDMISGTCALSDLSNQTPRIAFGQRVTTATHSGRTQALISVSDLSGFTESSAALTQRTDSWAYQLDTAHYFDSITYGLAGDPLQTKDLIQIVWQNTQEYASFSPNVPDWREYETLVLQIAQAPAEEQNIPGIYQSFSIRLTDSGGNTVTLSLPSEEGALRYISGEKAEYTVTTPPYLTWSRQTPLMDIRIPLAFFGGLDLSNITEVSLVFDQLDAGCLMLGGVFIAR